LGVELQNPDDLVFLFNDSSLVLNTYTSQKEDLISLDIQNLANSMLLGYQIDEPFGTFQHNFMTEVKLYDNSPKFGINAVADSLIMYLNFSYAFGDTNQIQTITVYELNSDDTLRTINGKEMDESVISQYYNPKPITTFSFRPSTSGAKSKNVQIKFPKEYIAKFMDTSQYASDEIFRTNVLNGFYFVANPVANRGAITYFSFNDSTHMALYYKNALGKSITYQYRLTSESYRCNIFKRIYNPEIQYLEYNEEGNPSIEQEYIYLKNSNSLEGRIEITGLDTWQDSGYFTLNKAILDVYAEYPQTEFDSMYFAPPALYIFKVGEDSARNFLSEYYNSKTGSFDPVKYDSLPNGYGYRFVINETLFNAIKAEEDKLSLMITASPSANLASASRLKLLGAKHTENPIKLKITYTKFNVE
jgi:hypothetical protein